MIAAPKTRQSLLSGEHKMFDAGKSAGPNCRESDCCAENSAEPEHCSTPESPQGRIAGTAPKTAGPAVGEA